MSKQAYYQMRDTKVYARWGHAIPYGRDKFLDLMRRKGLLIPHEPARAPRTTYADPDAGWVNLFKNLVLWRVGQAVVSDITYIRLPKGHCFLSLVTDAFSRKIVGWYVNATLEASGSLKALHRAIACYDDTRGLVHHSDRGIQYACKAYQTKIARQGMRTSMTVEDHCAENALAESINGVLKREFGLGRVFKTIHQVRRAVSQGVYIYNRYRPNRAMDNRTPDEVHYNTTITLNLSQLI
jgi:transposase InsO family protein